MLKGVTSRGDVIVLLVAHVLVGLVDCNRNAIHTQEACQKRSLQQRTLLVLFHVVMGASLQVFIHSTSANFTAWPSAV